MHNKKRLMEITIKTKQCDSTCRSLKKVESFSLNPCFLLNELLVEPFNQIQVLAFTKTVDSLLTRLTIQTIGVVFLENHP